MASVNKNKQYDAIWFNGLIMNNGQVIEADAIAVKSGKIAWIGKLAALRESPADLAETAHDLEGRLLTPGLIDCHTHLIFGGDRAHEFEQRLKGVSYEEISKAGGGIKSTVAETRLASEEALFSTALARAKSLMASGVTTIEIKSGYGLDLETELKMLRVAKKLSEQLPITIHRTFLGAHTVPKEFFGKTDSYIDYVCQEMIPKIASEKLADSVDVFSEKIAFDLPQTERVFKTAQKFGLTIKCHAEQLSSSGAATLSSKYHALSADHLEYANESDVLAMREAGTVAVLLPGAYYFLNEKQKPPVDLFRKHQVPMAIATDLNPGTSPIFSLPIIMHMACTLFRFTVEEAWLGVTKHAAKALGLSTSHGELKIGYRADFAVWDTKRPVELVYYLGKTLLAYTVHAGKMSER